MKPIVQTSKAERKSMIRRSRNAFPNCLSLLNKNTVLKKS